MNPPEQLYEFSSAFRGENYEWHPHPPPEARHWQALLVHCLRNQLREVVIESAAGRRWTVAWSAKSRNQVRGGSLRIEEILARPRESPDQPAPASEETIPGMRLAVAVLSNDSRWRLTREQWLAVIDPASEIANFFHAIELAIPSFAVWADDPNVTRNLDGLGHVDIVILVDVARPPSPVGSLLVEWLEGRGWLLARIGRSRAPAAELLGPELRAQSFATLAEIAQCGEQPVTGWDQVERVLSLFAEAAARWTNQRPIWQARLEHDARIPTLDTRAGVVEIPGTGDRRARKLAARVSADTTVAGPLPTPSPARFDKTHLAVGIAAMLVGMVFGFWCGYLWATKLLFH